jgi:hypothetical protein
MENNKLGTFTEEAYRDGKIFNLQIRATEPCTEEEKRIYGVDVKLAKDPPRYRIVGMDCYDGGVFYEIQLNNGWNKGSQSDVYFQDLNKAKEYLIEKAKEKKLL